MADNRRALELPFQFDAASHPREAARCKTVELQYYQTPNQERTTAQLEAFDRADPGLRNHPGALPGTAPFREKWRAYVPDERARSLVAINGEPLFRRVLYLFNVVIALEWNPSPHTYQQLRIAARRASDFLYDVSNGYMAFGQVIIGGPELMDGADIQVMASNRIHPRAWNNGLNEGRKFKSIRVGRGIWQKDLALLSTWDSPEGYRALVHEWGHYALNIRDGYLEDIILYHDGRRRQWREGGAEQPAAGATSVKAAVPRVALAIDNNLMTNAQISELPPWATIFETLRANFPLLPSDDPWDRRPVEGPAVLPLALPVFVELDQAGYRPGISIDLTHPDEHRLALNPADGTTGVQPAEHPDEAHWLYVLKRCDAHGLPDGIIAQGKVTERDRREGFQLFGAREGDALLLISQVRGTVQVRRAAVGPSPAPTEPGSLPTAIPAWEDATPPGLDQPFFIDVIPQAMDAAVRDPVAVTAHIEIVGQQPDAVQIYPFGQTSAHRLRRLRLTSDSAGTLSTDPQPVPHLDGHVLLRWCAAAGGGEALFIASYSQGGGPNSTTGGRSRGGLPITAGSSDGNAMVFFVDPERYPVQQDLPEDAPADRNEQVRIVTTTLTVGQQRLAEGGEARSYVFSLASNTPLVDYTATLVLYYDRDARRRRGDLLIYRWDRQRRRWRRHITFAPALPYVAIPLQKGLATAPALTGEVKAPPVERYRVFWTPRS